MTPSSQRHEVDSGIATFDIEHRPINSRKSHLTGGDPLLVAVDRTGVVGYASGVPYRPKAGYRLTRETSIYVSPRTQGRGLGRQL